MHVVGSMSQNRGVEGVLEKENTALAKHDGIMSVPVFRNNQ